MEQGQRITIHRTLKVIFIVLFLPYTGICFSEEKNLEVWLAGKPMPTARSGVAAAVVNNKIYVIGGYYIRDMKQCILSVNERYDPETDKWTIMANLPTARSGAAAAVLNNKIYVLGGIDNEEQILTENERYDPVTDTWEVLEKMPTPRAVPGAAGVNNKLYVIGGETYKEDKDGKKEIYLSVNEEYNPETNKWKERQQMPTARPRPCVAACNNEIYVIGGGELELSPISDANEKYNPAKDFWTILAPVPTGRTAAGASVLGDRIYIIGGYIMKPKSSEDSFILDFTRLNFLSCNEEYDIKSNCWNKRLNMPVNLAGAGAVTVNGSIHIIGGFNYESGFLDVNIKYLSNNKVGKY